MLVRALANLNERSVSSHHDDMLARHAHFPVEYVDVTLIE
jgi:hypothetical protein